MPEPVPQGDSRERTARGAMRRVMALSLLNGVVVIGTVLLLEYGAITRMQRVAAVCIWGGVYVVAAVLLTRHYRREGV